MEAGERIEDALRREAREELSVELASLKPLLFKDAVLPKTYSDGSRQDIHMVFLVYRCTLVSPDLVLNEEFSEAHWFSTADLARLPLSELTRDTLTQAGLLVTQS